MGQPTAMKNKRKGLPLPQATRITTAMVDETLIAESQQLVIEGEDGVFYFRYASSDGALTCWGGVHQHEAWRSFRPERCHLPGWRPARQIEVEVEDKLSRSGKYAAFEVWANAHQNEVFTTNELVEASGFSMATLLKYLSSSLVFDKVKRGQWRVRNLEATRVE